MCVTLTSIHGVEDVQQRESDDALLVQKKYRDVGLLEKQ